MLFRSEAIDAQHQRWLVPQGIRVDRVPPGMAILCACTIVALVAFCASAQVARKIIVAGNLEPDTGLGSLSTSVTGAVRAIRVSDGDMVSKGQAIFEIGTDVGIGLESASGRLTGAISQQKVALERQIELRRQEKTDRQGALSSKLHGLATQRDNLSQEITIARQRLALTEAEWRRQAALSESGLVTRAQAQGRELDYLAAKANVAASERALSSIDVDIQSTRTELSLLDSRLATDIEELRRSLLNADQASVEAGLRGAVTYVAPIDGRINLLRRIVGENVQANQTLATVIPAADIGADGRVALVATLYAPSRSVGLVKPGQRVAIKYQAFPYERYGADRGTVRDVGIAPIAYQELPTMYQRQAVQGNADGESWYRISVLLEPRDASRPAIALRTGLTFEAEIHHDQRAVWEWIFDPFRKARSLFG